MSVEPLRKPVECPSCQQVSKREFYPFCSKRCSEKDLFHWFSGNYAIAATDEESSQGEEF